MPYTLSDFEPVDHHDPNPYLFEGFERKLVELLLAEVGDQYTLDVEVLPCEGGELQGTSLTMREVLDSLDLSCLLSDDFLDRIDTAFSDFGFVDVRDWGY